MLNQERILKQDRLLRAVTRLNRKAFEEMLPSFQLAYEQSSLKPEGERKRAPGGGRKARLDTSRGKLMYILLYCKCYPTFDLLSVLFDFDRSCAHDWVHRLLPVLETALGYKQVLPVRQLRSVEEFLERFPDVKEVI
jgi:Helix-turn-helix of DDE superfamily endonuclease